MNLKARSRRNCADSPCEVGCKRWVAIHDRYLNRPVARCALSTFCCCSWEKNSSAFFESITREKFAIRFSQKTAPGFKKGCLSPNCEPLGRSLKNQPPQISAQGPPPAQGRNDCATPRAEKIVPVSAHPIFHGSWQGIQLGLVQ